MKINPTSGEKLFNVLIHSAKESVNNTVYGTEPNSVTIGAGDSKKALITKTNLNSISSDEYLCADDETLTRADSAIQKVSDIIHSSKIRGLLST